MITDRRDLPQVDALARSADGLAPGPVVRAEARRLVDEARARLADGPARDDLERELRARLAARRPLHRVVNATGVLLHTNLGRAPLAPLPAGEDGLGAVPVEMDLEQGHRGRRLAALEADLCDLTGAEAALVVNNNAAGLLLTLTALASGGEVVVSRGQLVEIGGSFRVPDIVVQGGALLREVGTTNRTHLDDYEAAIGEATRVLLEVHPSNFTQVGFVTSPPTREIAGLAGRHGLVMVHDIGSGLVDATTPWLRGGPPPWLRHDPAARQVLDAGAGVVTFSGDKLLGGPQAGIVCGDRVHLDRIRRHPLSRALRFDKLRAAQLHAVVRAHLDGSAATAIPFYRQAGAPVAELTARADRVRRALASSGWPVEIVDVEDYAGGGAAPQRAIPGVGLSIACDAAAVAAALRRQTPAVVATVRDGRLVLSMRTVDPADDDLVAEALVRVSAG